MSVDGAILIGFLMEVGRWAKSELSEIWKLRRSQQEAELANKAQAEEVLPIQIESIMSEKDPQEIDQITLLIKRKRDAINRARNAKLADLEQFDRQEMLQAAFEEREKRHNKTIRNLMDEIELDLNELGFDVEREVV